MADVSLRAELQLKDGQRQKICIQVHKTLSSLVGGINELNVNVSHLLTQIVEREKKACSVGEEEEGSDEEGNMDEEEDSAEEEESLSLRPPAKRLKP